MSLYADLPEITVKMDGPVAVVTLDRPKQRNAFTEKMKESMITAFQRLDADDHCKVVVLTGAPNAGNAFCAG
jgi:enoyl-CoA hydratase/carnithine racemase